MIIKRSTGLLAAFIVLASVIIAVPAAAQEGEVVIMHFSQSSTHEADVTFTVTAGVKREYLSAEEKISVGVFVGGQLIGYGDTGLGGTVTIPYHFVEPGAITVVVKANKPPYTMTSGAFTAVYEPLASPSEPIATIPTPIVSVPAPDVFNVPTHAIETATSSVNATALNQTSSNAKSTSLTPGFEFVGALMGLVLVALFMVHKRYR